MISLINLLDACSKFKEHCKVKFPHITVFTKDECRTLGSTQTESILKSDVKGIVILGHGTNDGVHYLVVQWHGGQLLRKQYGFPEKQFHVTMSSKDSHTIDKSWKTIIEPNEFSERDITNIVEPDTPFELLNFVFDNLKSPSDTLFYAIFRQHYLRLEETDEIFLVGMAQRYPTFVSPTFILLEKSFKQRLYKKTMVIGLSILSTFDNITDKMENKVRNILRECAKFTEWGPFCTETELQQLVDLDDIVQL